MNGKARVTVIIGPQGSGKTTFLRRLEKEYAKWHNILMPVQFPDKIFLEKIKEYDCIGIDEVIDKELLFWLLGFVNKHNPSTHFIVTSQFVELEEIHELAYELRSSVLVIELNRIGHSSHSIWNY